MEKLIRKCPHCLKCCEAKVNKDTKEVVCTECGQNQDISEDILKVCTE